MSLELFIGLALGAFLCEYIALSLGMGYGIILVPALLFLGFKPLQAVPVVLMSEFISGIIGAFFHHKFKNVDFRFGTRDFKIVTTMIVCSIIGAAIAVLVAINIPQLILKLFIGIIILSMGIIILVTRKMSIPFSWTKITVLTLVAAFNKGMSGGGYGPLVTGAQILSGVPSKNAVGITSLAKAIACMIGVLMYLLTKSQVDFFLASPLILGAVISVPFATLSVKKIPQETMKFFIGILTTFLGVLILIKIFS